MCTLSWWVEPDRCGVLFNRDEQHSRHSGAAPRLLEHGDYPVLAPLDPDAGGTWIGVNEHGLVVALLNRYGQDTTEVTQRRSRGKLVLDLVSHQPSASAFARHLEQLDLSPYPACILFCLDQRQQPKAFQWNGRSLSELALDATIPCLTTSSVQSENCVAYRRGLFEAARTRDELAVAHLHFNSLQPALGPLMYRDDAATDCLTEIVLEGGSARMTFQSFEGSPPVAGDLTEHFISLRERV